MFLKIVLEGNIKMENIHNVESSSHSLSNIQNVESENPIEIIRKNESSTSSLDKGLEFIALSSLIMSVSLSIIGVITRYFMGVSYDIIEELCRYSIIYGVFAYIGPLIKKNEHIKMDLLQNLLKDKRLKYINDLIINIILLLSFGFLFWSGIQWVNSLLQINLMTSTGSMLMFIPTLAIPLGMFFACIYSFQQIIVDFNKIRLYKTTNKNTEMEDPNC